MQCNAVYCDTIQESAVPYDTTKFSDVRGDFAPTILRVLHRQYHYYHYHCYYHIYKCHHQYHYSNNITNNTIDMNISSHTTADVTVF